MMKPLMQRRSNWIITLCILAVLLSIWMLFGNDLLAEYEYRTLLRRAYRDGHLGRDSFYDFSPTTHKGRPPIELSLSAPDTHRLEMLIKSRGYRDRVLDEINKTAKSDAQRRVQSYLLHFLSFRWPDDDLIKPILRDLKSTDKSVYYIACRSLNDSLLNELTLPELIELRTLLSKESVPPESRFADADVSEDTYEELRESTVASVNERIDALTKTQNISHEAARKIDRAT